MAGCLPTSRPVGPTLIRVDEFRDWPLRAVFYGGRDVTDEPTEFTREDLEAQVVLTQRDSVLTGASLMGQARPGQAVDGVVLVFPDHPRRWHEQFSFVGYAGGNGQFRDYGIRPGRYLAVAVSRDDASLSDVPTQYFRIPGETRSAGRPARGRTRQINLRRARLRD